MPYPAIEILVCTNERPLEAKKPCCARRGSMEVYHRFKDVIRERGLRDTVIVTRTGCLKHCSQGITVGVWPWNIWYRRVTLADVEEIVDTTVEGDGGVVQRLRLPEDAVWE